MADEEEALSQIDLTVDSEPEQAPDKCIRVQFLTTKQVRRASDTIVLSDVDAWCLFALDCSPHLLGNSALLQSIFLFLLCCL